MYLKIFAKDDNHHGFQYKDGLNVDTNIFELYGSCVAGGLYFTTAGHITKFLDYGKYIRVVEIPDTAEMVKDPGGDKWRASALFLHPRKSLRDIDTWKWLIEQNVDKDYAVSWASQNGYLEILELLLKNGANYAYNNNYALRVASQKGHSEIVELLIKYGADCTAWENYALRHAARNGRLKVVKVLLKHGADCTTYDNMAIHEANANNHFKVARVMIQHLEAIESERKYNNKNV